MAWHNYKPYAFRNESDHVLQGTDVQLLSKLLNKLGCRYRFVEMTWARTLKEIAHGRVDISMFASKTKERAGLFHFSIPYRNESVRIISLTENKNNWAITSLSDLDKDNVSLVTDLHAWFGGDFENFLQTSKRARITHEVEIEQRLKLLLAKHYDLAIGDPVSFIDEAKRLGLEDKIYILPFKVYDNPVHFIMNNNTIDHSFVEALDQAIQCELALKDRKSC